MRRPLSGLMVAGSMTEGAATGALLYHRDYLLAGWVAFFWAYTVWLWSRPKRDHPDQPI